MGWGNFLVTTAEAGVLDEYLTDFHDDPVVTVHRPAAVDGKHLAVIGVDCVAVRLVCDECGRQQCPGCGSSVVVDLDTGMTLCSLCRKKQ